MEENNDIAYHQARRDRNIREANSLLYGVREQLEDIQDLMDSYDTFSESCPVCGHHVGASAVAIDHPSAHNSYACSGSCAQSAARLLDNLKRWNEE